VTILGRGDLSPRRRHRSVGRYVTVVLVLAVLAGGGYAAYVGFIQGSSTASTPTAPLALCPKPTTTVLFAPPHKVRLAVLNASLHTGLAAEVRTELRHRGFHVTQIGNAMRVGHDVATIRYSPDERREYRSVAAQIPGEATILPVSGRHILELDLGVHFRQLQSVAAARATERRLVAGSVTSASASPSPSCRARH
jgi:hypothetical protein